jgi:hypothetical protein
MVYISRSPECGDKCIKLDDAPRVAAESVHTSLQIENKSENVHLSNEEYQPYLKNVLMIISIL